MSTIKAIKWTTLLAATVLTAVSVPAQDIEPPARLRPLEFPAVAPRTAELPAALASALDRVLPTLTIPQLQEVLDDGDITSEMLVSRPP